MPKHTYSCCESCQCDCNCQCNCGGGSRRGKKKARRKGAATGAASAEARQLFALIGAELDSNDDTHNPQERFRLISQEMADVLETNGYEKGTRGSYQEAVGSALEIMSTEAPLRLRRTRVEKNRAAANSRTPRHTRFDENPRDIPTSVSWVDGD